jgi:hypothetical protein
VWGLARAARAKRTVNKRLLVAERTGSLEDLVVELRKHAASPPPATGASAGSGCRS